MVREGYTSSGSRGGSGSPGPPCSQEIFKIMQFSAILGESPILSKFWAQGPSLGSKLRWAPPMTRILDPRLSTVSTLPTAVGAAPLSP